MSRIGGTRTTQGYVCDGRNTFFSTGTMGTLGSSVGSGIYIAFTIATTVTSRVAVFGSNHSGGPELDVFLNWNWSTTLANSVDFNMRDTTGKRLEGHIVNSGLFDGNVHTVVITVTPGTNTIVMTLDGAAQTMVYTTQATPASFADYTTTFFVGAWYNGSGVANPFAGTLYSVQVGTSANALFLNCVFTTQGRVPIGLNTPIIIDTDAASDIDDYGAVTCAYQQQVLGNCTILGINVDTSSTYSPGALDAQRKFMGLPAITFSSHAAVGTFLPAAANACYQYVYNNFSHDVGLANTLATPNTNFRTLLAARTKPDVVMIGLGYGNDLAALLQSPADGISSLTGLQLVAASVSYLVWTGGIYPSGTDPANFARDLTDAAYVIQNWPTPIVFFPGGSTNGSIGGDMNTPNPLLSLPALSPILACYQQFGAGVSGHASWDLCTSMIGIEGLNAWTTVQGTNSLNTSSGVNTFTAGAGNQYYVNTNQPYTFYINHFTQLMRGY